MPVLTNLGEFCASLCASEIGVGINSGVSFGRIAEHHALVARAARIHTHGDVARLPVDRRDHRTRIRVEAVQRIVVPDRRDVPRTRL